MIYIYDLVLFLLIIPAGVLLLLSNRKRLTKGSFAKWYERLGFWDFSKISRGGKKLLWFHCASLGEVRAIEPLIKRLAGDEFIITTMTHSAHVYAKEKKLSPCIYFLPLDFTFIVRKVIKRVKADMLILVETEIWPGLVTEAAKSGMKVISINGRLSSNSYAYYQLLKPLWKKVLSKIDMVSARSAEDADRFIALGCPAGRLKISGNIKYDTLFNMPEVSRAELGFAPKDLILAAGSTRGGEEEIILAEWIRLREKHGNIRLVIAPRHITRAPEIAQLCRNMGIDFRLKTDASVGNSDCLILDTFGELQKYYAVCDIALIGGSLVDNGGQNPIEPAAFAKPVVFGVYMQNFSEEARGLENSGGGIRVTGREELFIALDRLISDPGHRARTGECAKRAVDNQKGAVEKTLSIIEKVLND
jgi:3-deoxy-D-manno-octulosonic-acid transferase